MLRLGIRSLPAAALFAVAFLSPAFAEQPAKSDVDLKKLSVDELVERLASPFPAPRLSNRGFDPEADRAFYAHPHFSQDTLRIIHPSVVAATNELSARGRAAVPSLLKHKDDPRYCWTGSFAAIRDLSVGYQVMEIVEEILEPKIQIEARMGVFKGYPNFTNYLGEVGPNRYLEWSNDATERESELDLLRWYVRKVDDEYGQREHLGTESGSAWLDEHLVPFRERVAELEAAGVTTKGPRDEASATNAEAKPPTGDR